MMAAAAYQPSRRAMRASAPMIADARAEGETVEHEMKEGPEEAYETPVEISDLVAMFEDSELASTSGRQQSERCRDYYDNKQLTQEERAELAARGQPEIIRNQIKGKVNFWLGFEAKNRSDPRAESEHGTNEDDASDATDMLRFQERRARLDQKFSDAWENMLIEGYCGIEVMGPSRKDPRVIDVKRWKWDRLFFDPHSSEHDFSDAMYVGGVIWQDLDEAKRKWPDHADSLDSSVASERSLSRTYDDKPRTMIWAMRNGKRVRVRIVQIYYRHGDDWHWAIFTKGGILESGAVELRDEQGYSVCPLIMQALYVDRENNRYGEVAEFLSTQDEINKRASKALHLANSAQTVGEQGAILDVDKFKAEKARPDGHLEVAPGALSTKRFEFIEHNDKVSLQREMMGDAIMSIEKRGPNAALMGTQSSAPSGRAIRANQEGGMIEGARPRDRLNDLKTRVYQAIWQRVRQFCTEETWVSVTDDEGAARLVGFNRTVTMAEKLVEEAKRQGMPDEEIQGRMQMLVQDPNAAAQLQMPTKVKVPMEMDLNVIIEPVSESVTMQQESFELVASRQDVPFGVLLELWPGPGRQKRKIRDLMKKEQAEAAQAAAPGMKIKADNLMADTEAKRARAMKDMADADKAEVEMRTGPAEAAARIAGQQQAPMQQPPESPYAPGAPYAGP